MFRSTLAALVVVVGAFASSAHSSVILGDRQWLQPADLLGYTWNDFDAACPNGVCAGSLSGAGPDITGWNWASIDVVGDLFAALSPHPGGIASFFSPEPFLGFDVVSTSGFTVTSSLELAINFGISGVAGYSSTPGPQPGSAYWGVIQVGLFPGFSRGTTIDTTATIETDLPTDVIGAWLYRTHAVPAPSSLLLLAAGFILVCGGRSRRREPAGR